MSKFIIEYIVPIFFLVLGIFGIATTAAFLHNRDDRPPSTIRVIEWNCVKLQNQQCITWRKTEYPQGVKI